MKALILTLALALLTGCTTVVPVTQKFPDAPSQHSLTTCPQLQKLEATAQLTDVAKTVAGNYSEYYTCAVKLDAWIEWYEINKIIYKGLR